MQGTISPAHRAFFENIYREAQEAILTVPTIEERTEAVHASIVADIHLNCPRDVVEGEAFQKFKNKCPKAPPAIPGESYEDQHQRIKIMINNYMSNLQEKTLAELQRRSRAAYGKFKARQTLPPNLLAIVPPERRSQINKDYALEVVPELKKALLPTDIKLRLKKGVAKLKEYNQELEANLISHVSRVEAYIAFAEQNKVAYDAINESEFEAFFEQYKIEKAERSFQKLDLELEAEQPTSTPVVKQKKKNKKQGKKPVTVHVPSAPAQSPAEPAPAQMTPEQVRQSKCLEWFNTPALPLHQRVKRWEAPLETIRDFIDGTGAHQTRPYADREKISDSQLELIKACHNTLGPEKLLVAIPDAYSFATPTGYGLLCCLRWDDSTKKSMMGTLYYGIDKHRGNLVYHRFLVEQDISHSLKAVFKGPELQQHLHEVTPEIDSEEKELILAGAYEPTVSPKGVVRLRYAARGYSLDIFPVRPNQLPKGMFHN